MRTTCLVVLSILVLSTAAPSGAETVRLTMYDDGLSCPGNCDPHVVFHPTMNGTEFAHDPSTTAPPFGKCRSGQICRICLESGGKQCFQIMYRGAGPPPKTFDFTPNFYQTACAGTPPQPELARKCETLRTAAAALVGRQNCIADPGHALCTELIQSAAARRSADRAEFEQCVASGEQEYNKRKPPPQQRALGCAYEKTGTGGPNSKGKTWRKLLPGACRDGTFVGRDGLDCCSGITLNDGPLGSECRAFYPRPPG